MAKKVIITGSTGMVGSNVLKCTLESEKIGEVIALVRKNTGTEHQKYTEIVVSDFLHLHRFSELFSNVDIVYYCLGAYTGSLSKDEFRKVNVDFPNHLAQVVKAINPAITFVLLSGAGADLNEKSRFQFARDKGTIENLLMAYFNKNFYSARPGYIYPVEKRKEPNFTYRLMRWLFPLIKLFGKSSYISSHDLAKVIFRIGLEQPKHLNIFENKDLHQFLNQ